MCCETEGIIPANGLPKGHLLVMNMRGRGDEDIDTVARHLGVDIVSGG